MAMRAHSAVAAPIAVPARAAQRGRAHRGQIRPSKSRHSVVASGLLAKALSTVRSSDATDVVYADGEKVTYPTVLYAFREDGSCVVTNCATGKVIQRVRGDGNAIDFASQTEEPVAAPAPVADTTPALYYYTPNGLRVHTTHTCWGLRNAKAIFVSPTCELRGKTRCNVCFLR